MENTAKKINFVSHELEGLDNNTFSIMRYALMVTPDDINKETSYWEAKLKSANTDEEKSKITSCIQALEAIRINNINLTMNAYHIGLDPIKAFNSTTKKEEKKPEETKQVTDKQQTAEQKKDNKQPEKVVDKPDVNSITGVSVKIAKYLLPNGKPRFNVEQFRAELIKNKETKENAIEIATYILGKGLYTGKKPVPWKIDDRFNNWISAIFATPAKKEEPITKQVEPSKVEDKKDMPLEEKYKSYNEEHPITLKGLEVEVREMVKEDPKNIDSAVELVTYITTRGLYAEKTDKDPAWDSLAISKFIDDAIKGLSSPIEDKPADNKEITGSTAKEEIKFADVFNMVKKNVEDTEDATMDSVKSFVKNLSESYTIENFSELATEKGFDTAWGSLFAITTQAMLDKKSGTIGSEEDANKAIDTFTKEVLEANKAAIEEGKSDDFKEFHLVSSLRKYATTLSLPESKKTLHDLLNKVGIKAPWLETPKSEPAVGETKNVETTDKKEKENESTPAIVDINSADTSKYPDVEQDLKDSIDIVELFKIVKKHSGESEEKNLVVATLVTKLFKGEKVTSKGKGGEVNPLKMDDTKVETWINKNMNPIKKDQKKQENTDKVKPEDKKEDKKETPKPETKVEDKKENKPVESKTDSPVEQQKETAKDKDGVKPLSEMYPQINKARNKPDFIKALVEVYDQLFTASKDENKSYDLLSDLVMEARNIKKTFAKDAYKKSSKEEIIKGITNYITDAKKA